MAMAPLETRIAAVNGSAGRGKAAIILLVVVALAAAPYLIYPMFLINVLCFALFACAFNLVMGYSGLLSFGHAAFFGSAAYISGYCAKTVGLPAELAILVATSCSAVLGLVFGWVAIRKQGIYFGMITLAMAQVVYFIAVQAPFTGGEDGLQGIPRKALVSGMAPMSDRQSYFFVLAFFLIGFGIIYRIVHSPFGHILRSIRENETRAASLGYDVDRIKLLSFTLSATLSGVAGAVKAIGFQLATLTDVEFFMSGEVVLMVLVGGVATMTGPVLGATIIIAMQYYLSEFGSWVKALHGMIFIVCVMAFRRGIVGEIGAYLSRRRG